MYSLIGRKVGMSQVFSKGGDLIAVTAIEVEPNLVIGKKSQEKDGYGALVVGYGEIKESRLNKPDKGQFKGKEVRRHLYELRGLPVESYGEGETITMEKVLKVGDFIDVQGRTRGHGFTGAIKLWNFKCGPKTHGSGYPHRFGGSLETGRGGSAPQKIWKGKKMAGRYGNSLVSAVNLEIVHMDPEKQIFMVRGCVPGRARGILKIKPTTRRIKANPKPFELHRSTKE